MSLLAGNAGWTSAGIYSDHGKKAEAEAVLKKLLASGMSADEILEKLK